MAQQILFDNRSGSTLNWYYAISNKGVQSGVLYRGQQIVLPVPSGIQSVGCNVKCSGAICDWSGARAIGGKGH